MTLIFTHWPFTDPEVRHTFVCLCECMCGTAVWTINASAVAWQPMKQSDAFLTDQPSDTQPPHGSPDQRQIVSLSALRGEILQLLAWPWVGLINNVCKIKDVLSHHLCHPCTQLINMPFSVTPIGSFTSWHQARYVFMCTQCGHR